MKIKEWISQFHHSQTFERTELRIFDYSTRSYFKVGHTPSVTADDFGKFRDSEIKNVTFDMVIESGMPKLTYYLEIKR